MTRCGGLQGLLLLLLLTSGNALGAEGAAPADAAATATEPAPPAPEQVTPSTDECRPSCRSGFVCVDAACVSACNPACSANERCDSSGECVASARSVSLDSEEPTQDEDEPSSPSIHRHDGFYLRFSLGIGMLLGSHDEEYFDPAAPFGSFRTLTLPHDVSGVAQVGELLLGGTPVPGLVLGGGLWGVNVPSPHVTGTLIDDNDAKVSFDTHSDLLSASMLGPFASYYPNPSKGWHATFAAGFVFATSGDEADITEGPDLNSWDGNGWGVLVAGGHDFWVGEQWSFGVLGRVTYLRTSHQKELFSAWVPALLLSATWH